MLDATFCSTQNIGWDFSLARYGGDKIPLNWYRLWSMSISRSLSRTQKRQSPARAWKRVHARRCHEGRSLRRWSAAARLLGLWVRISMGAWMCVSLECCVLSGWSLVQRSLTECDGEALIMRRPWPTECCCDMGEKIHIVWMYWNEWYVHCVLWNIMKYCQHVQLL